MPRNPTATRQPGDTPADTEHDENAAIAAAQSGGTHKVAKPRPAAPKSPVVGDPARPKDAVVNQREEMSYDEAMKLLAEGKLTRSVLTEQGWVAVTKTPPPGALKV